MLPGGVRSAGGLNGAAPATTTTADVAEAGFPEESLARNVTTVVPRANDDGASFVTGTAPSMVSAATAERRKAAICGSVAATLGAPFEETVIRAGTVNVGGSVSETTMSNVALAE